MSVCVVSPQQPSANMSISHMPRGASASIMQGLPHHLHNSLPQSGGGGSGMFGGVSDAVNRNMDDPNPDMLLALLARNKALEGKSHAMLFIPSHLYFKHFGIPTKSFYFNLFYS